MLYQLLYSAKVLYTYMPLVSVTLLTIYDMCKAIDKSMEISDIRLLHKEGGKSGVYDYEK